MRRGADFSGSCLFAPNSVRIDEVWDSKALSPNGPHRCMRRLCTDTSALSSGGSALYVGLK